MAYTTGVLETFVPADLKAVITAALDLHPAWEFVAEVNQAASSTYDDFTVYKCLGTLNDQGADFFLIFKVTAGWIYYNVCEEVDVISATKRWRNYGVAGSNTPKNIDSVGRYTVSGVAQWDQPFENATYGFGAAQSFTGSMQYAAAYTQWFMSITNSLFVFGVRYGTTTYSGYMGLFDPFRVDDPFPLVAIAFAYNSTSTTSYLEGGMTRHPNPGAQVLANDRSFFSVWPCASSSSRLFGIPYQGATNGVVGGLKEVFLDSVGAARIVLGSKSLPLGWARGLLKANILFAQANSSVVIGGDTVTIDGKTWVTIQNSLWLDTQALDTV